MREKLATASSALAQLDLELEYRSDQHDLIDDFYLPCLQRSSLYRRAVGFFTSRGLAIAAQGITYLIQRGGAMRLVASPLLHREDLEAIEQGYLARTDAVSRALLREIETTPDAVVKNRLGYLAWMIAEERLELRIAVPVDEQERARPGIYHEKLGVFSDGAGNAVVFTGSPNETAGGLVDNFEAIDVFCSWKDAERASRKIDHFEQLWQDETPGLSVIAFPRAVREQLLRYRPAKRPDSEAAVWPSRPKPLPFDENLWEHQIEAIRAWEDNDRQGLLSMATGSGKTRTALVASERCPSLDLLVVAVPSKALVEQWNDELQQRTRLPPALLVHGSHRQWQDRLFSRLRAARRSPGQGPVVAIGTLNSLSGDRFESVLRDSNAQENALLIVDEAHNAGAPTFRRVLRELFPWRLGLSATPARHFDEQGTAALLQYFGSTVYTYGMRRALEEGRLCPYRYFVYPAHLSSEEFDQYSRLTRQIISARGRSRKGLSQRTDNLVDGDSTKVQRLLERRARILKKCSAKLDALATALSENPAERGLIYCADHEQLDSVSDLMGQRGHLFLSYTSKNSPAERQAALEALASGHVPWIIAIDCLDEGVDVPAVDEALLLASSSNKRQFIQRRGRILRKALGKEVATLIDVIALPPTSEGPSARWMLRGELARVREMAELAMNREDALLSVKRCAEQYGVLMTELLSGEGDG